jgi:hypothetical protein
VKAATKAEGVNILSNSTQTYFRPLIPKSRNSNKVDSRICVQMERLLDKRYSTGILISFPASQMMPSASIGRPRSTARAKQPPWVRPSATLSNYVVLCL